MSLLISGSFLVPIVPAAVVVAADDPPVEVNVQNGLCAGASFSASAQCDQTTVTNSKSTVTDLITTAVNIFSVVIGVIAVIMIIVGGLKYITSSGDANNLTSAKNTILYALVGLVVVALAQIIVRFVLSKVGEATAPAAPTT